VDRETRSSILPIRTRYRFSSVVERGPPKPDVDCSIQSAGANFFSCLGGPLAGIQRAAAVLRSEFALHKLAFCAIARSMPSFHVSIVLKTDLAAMAVLERRTEIDVPPCARCVTGRSKKISVQLTCARAPAERVSPAKRCAC
jgi:hypothetical protein